MKPVERKQTALHPGHYSSAMRCGDLLFVSGQLPIDWATGKIVSGGVEEHARQALENLEALLDAEGFAKSDVAKTTVYIPDVAMWPQVDAVYARFFGNHKPARSVVPTNALHYNALVEVEAIACRQQKAGRP